MNPTPKLDFEKEYVDALQLHMQRPHNGRTTYGSARTLGRKGQSLGLNAMDLARAHELAAAILASHPKPNPMGERKSKRSMSTGSVFLLEALGSFENERAKEEATTREKLKAAERRYEELAAQSERIQTLNRRVAHEFLLAHEEERKKISRELHDQVAQLLAGVNLRLVAVNRASKIGTAILKDRISETQHLVEQSLETVSHFAYQLHPAILDDLGLIPSLRSFIRDLPRDKDLVVRFSAFHGVETLDKNQLTTFYRVAQEALTNVVRHAQAKLVSVTIRKLRNSVRLTVSDDGKSFHIDAVPFADSRHLGLLGMRERVEMGGGSFAIKSSPGDGTTVTAELPTAAA